ncbi:MAG TPA: ABC transporter ATP-binding protein [Candidatus Brachybacterium intestinipullorum]|uniref:ABC transporter ATP-binding protein n=1 Tax=Candidatus Brachybacterium intestinipullorum TaxID=2838512 RepID=A0A9D2PYF1_9MICO|nr:ABC transporter ATP-binding protein [Candidatus Brachybacterium intestinipullorum]
MNGTPVLEVDALRVDYLPAPGRLGAEPVHAVQDVGFTLHPAERLAIIGESGSGKSTLVQTLLGVLPPNARVHARRVVVDGVVTQEGTEGIDENAWNRLRRGRIAYIPQDPNIALNPMMRIGRQIAEGIRYAEPQVERVDREKRAIELLEQVGIEDAQRVHDAHPHQLSGGQRQRVLIAIALIGSPRVIVADEPTSGLDVEVQKRVLDLLDEIVDTSQVAIVLVTHDLAVAAHRSDRILVLGGGRILEQGPTSRVVLDPRAAYTRRLLDAVPRPARLRRREARDEAPPHVRVEGLTRTYRLRDRGRGRLEVHAARDVGFTIGRGRTYGLVGRSGSGKSTIARVLAGIDRSGSGQVLIGERSLVGGTRAERRAAARAVQYVFQNPYGSLDPRQDVRRILAEPLEGLGIPARSEESQRRVREALDAVALPAGHLERRPRELSGGQRQRVAIARGLIARPELLVLDEPVSALDVSVQAQVIELLVQLQRELGTTYLLISHDLAVISQIADTVGVLHHGVLVEEGAPGALLENPREESTRRLVDAVPPPLPVPSPLPAAAGG